MTDQGLYAVLSVKRLQHEFTPGNLIPSPARRARLALEYVWGARTA